MGEVIDKVYTISLSDKCLPKYDKYINENIPKVQKPTEQQIKAFGKELLDIYKKRITEIKKDATREVLNCGFNAVINGGTRKHLPFLPTSPRDITKDDVCDMLNVIRTNRIMNVRRVYGALH